MKSTKVELIPLLEEALKKESDNFKRLKIKAMIDRAKNGYYHSFESPILEPKFQLLTDLESVHLYDITELVRLGEFDEIATTVPRNNNCPDCQSVKYLYASQCWWCGMEFSI